jgi:hypothetical protein
MVVMVVVVEKQAQVLVLMVLGEGLEKRKLM